MFSLAENSTFRELNENLIEISNQFDCGNEDLNDFFINDSIKYSSQLMGKTYCFTSDENDKDIIAAFTVSNNSIKTDSLPKSTRNKLGRSIPWEKQGKNYPAVLLGRLGVSDNYKNKGIGTQIINFVKAWFVDSNNKTGCRYIVVDAYNEKILTDFYKKNGFKFLFSSEDVELEYSGLDKDETLRTRLMYFDLIKISS